MTTPIRHAKLFEPNTPYQPPADAPYISDTDVAALNREATRYKDEGDWTAALACLFQAKRLTENEIQHFPQRLRLPLFLQQAGHFEAAKYEFLYLLEHMDDFVALDVAGMQDLRLKKSFVKNHCLERLFDKARLVFEREKQIGQAEKCRALSAQYQEKRIQARESLDEACQKRLQAHRERFPLSSADTVTYREASRNDTIRAQATPPHTLCRDNPLAPPIPQPAQKHSMIVRVGRIVLIAVILWLIFG